MNPPPLHSAPPPTPPEKCFARQAALASLAAPVLAILVAAAVHVAASGSGQMSPIVRIISGLICLILIVIGLVLGILGLCGIRQHGPRGILGVGAAGVTLNGLLLAFVVIGFIGGLSNRLKSHQATRELKATVQQIQENAKNSYNSETGITNLDVKSVDRLRSQFDSAAQTMSGDDALIAKVMSAYVKRMESAAQDYQQAAADLRNAKVLSLQTLTDKNQIQYRRLVVQAFVTANDKLEGVISNGVTDIQADLTRLQVSPENAGAAIEGFRSRADVQTPILLKIRGCDDRMGQAMLGVLDLLQNNWGKWKYDSAANTVNFDDPAAENSYEQMVVAIKRAGEEQVEYQGQLVSLPQQ